MTRKRLQLRGGSVLAAVAVFVAIVFGGALPLILGLIAAVTIADALVPDFH
jgi:hypothetical protein